MKFTKLLLAFGTIAMAVASAAQGVYKITINDPVMVNGTLLKPNDYKIEMQGDKAVILKGKKEVAEAPAKLVSSDTKYDETAVQLDTSTGKPVVDQIEVGGTNAKIVFAPGPDG